jgi:hypothetical protein
MGGIKASPLGRTMGAGPVNAATVINKFLGTAAEKRGRVPPSERRTRLLSNCSINEANKFSGRQLINDAASVITNAGGAILNGISSLDESRRSRTDLAQAPKTSQTKPRWVGLSRVRSSITFSETEADLGNRCPVRC